ncbi:MAG: WYL domain-containing protein, partial [Marinibacterium sp.]|nr:WYL domain-containing protein [Marinibacterium sp.]
GGSAMARAADEALIKIHEVLPEEARAQAERVQLHAFAPGLTREVRDRLDALELAARDRAVLRLSYLDGAGAASSRDVQPLGLWFWGKVWTLVAWCRLRGDFRAFRVDRIAGMTRTGETFRPTRGQELPDFYAKMRDQGETPPGVTPD